MMEKIEECLESVKKIMYTYNAMGALRLYMGALRLIIREGILY